MVISNGTSSWGSLKWNRAGRSPVVPEQAFDAEATGVIAGRNIRASRCSEYSVSPCVDQDQQLLAGVSSPASVTVGEGGNISLSPSDYVGPCGTLSSSESVAVCPVGPDGTLSSSDLAGILFPAVPTGIPFPVGPVGSYGTLSQ